MRLKNSTDRFGLVSILFHWIMAVIVISLLMVGLYMVSLPASPEKQNLYGLHKAFGLLILALTLPRLVWRFVNVVPSLSLPRWERLSALFVHYAFYVFLIAMPLSGWLLSSAAGYAPSFFGLFDLPLLIKPNDALRPIFQTIHAWTGYGLIATICLHTAAAFKHHFIDKDSILKRMIS